MQAPIPEQKVRAEKEIVASDYGPFGAFDKAVAVYLDHSLFPLIQSMIDRVSEIQLEHRTPYGELTSVFKRYFENFVLEGWTYAISFAYRIATSHVIEKTGRLLDYKKQELIEYRAKQREIPIGLVDEVKDRLAMAIGKTNLAISRMKGHMDAPQKIQTALGFVFGVIFVSAILAIAVFIPVPSDF
jgi:hypothetical protein